MSLYTLSTPVILPPAPLAGHLRFTACEDLELLARLGEIPVDEARRRLANDHLAFVAYLQDEPAAFGWMARGKARIGELNHEFILPEGHRYLWNFRTRSKFRGLGIYPLLLQHIVRLESLKAERFWIIHAPENGSSLKGIRKAGFTYVGELFVNDDGRAAIQPEDKVAVDPFLDHMGFVRTNAIAASCWNCSSPYLKKRKPACCCAEAEKVCTRNKLSAFARH